MPSHFFYADMPRLYRRASANGPPDKLEGAVMQTLHSFRPCWLSTRFASLRPQPPFTQLSLYASVVAMLLPRSGDLPREPEAFQNHSSVTLRRPSSPKVAKPLLTRRPSLRKSALAFDLLHALLRSRLTPPHAFLQPAKSRLILIKRKDLSRKDDKEICALHLHLVGRGHRSLVVAGSSSFTKTTPLWRCGVTLDFACSKKKRKAESKVRAKPRRFKVNLLGQRPPGKLEGAWSGSPGKLEGTRPYASVCAVASTDLGLFNHSILGNDLLHCIRWGFGPSVWLHCCSSLCRVFPSGFLGY